MNGERKRRVLVVCTGNTCRSQMAEGWIRHLLGDRVEVASAGTRPGDRVAPLAIRAMAEVGIDLAGQAPEPVGRYLHGEWDLVVTVCGGAREECPVVPGAARTVHVGIDDPWNGTIEDYRAARDAIRDRVVPRVAAELGLG